MPPKNTGPLLSAGFLKHLGVEAKESQGNRRRTGVQNRKEQRKEARSKPQPHRQQTGRPQRHEPTQSRQNDTRPRPPSKPHVAAPPSNGKAQGKPAMRVINPEDEDDSIDDDDLDDDDLDEDDLDDDDDDDDEDDEDDEDMEDGDDTEDDSDAIDTPAAPSGKIPARMRERIAQDDAEIAELERKLGMKGRKNLPQSFKDDGLGDLLEDLDAPAGEDKEAKQKNKRKAEADEWLQAKRQKALGLAQKQANGAGDEGNEDDDDDFGGFDDSDSDVSGSDADRKSSKVDKTKQETRQRENPYVAPVAASDAPQKYIPPALRRAMQQGTDSESEAVSRVRRQAHHLIARLSDANMLTILAEVEKMYLDNPRQYVTDAVTDKLLEQVQIDGALTSNVTVLIAGFATAVYMVKGTDFGAHFIQQNATVFKQQYEALVAAEAKQKLAASSADGWTPPSKTAINLFSLMAELYNFRMIGPNLIYDYVRMLLGSLTETNTELLLRVFETSGTRLRQDDPRSLKDIVALIQPAVVAAGGEKSLSVRTRHMIERITDIKKSEKKKQRDAESSGFGHAERIRKMLGNLPTSRKLEAAGPLRVGLADIEQSDKRGKWWLVGASWAGKDEAAANGSGAAQDASKEATADPAKSTKSKSKSKTKQSDDSDDDVLGSWGDDIADVEELDLLAREQGMNTDARRSIFVTLLSAADSKDAHARLLRLRLNKHDRREIANVLIRCVGSEQTYNRYYALVARQVCSHDRRMSWVFQASLWKLFRRAGEHMFGEVPDSGDEGDGDDEEGGDDATNLRRIVNTAKLYGFMIACGSLSLDVLKCLSLFRLGTKIRMFVEVLLISLFEEIQKAAKAAGMDAKAMIKKRFRLGKDKDDMRRGLQYFIDKVLRKSTIIEKHQAASIAKACDRAQKALRESQED